MATVVHAQGEWWLPDSDHKVAGSLTWNITDGGTLHLNGRLHPIVVEDFALDDGSVQQVQRKPGSGAGEQYPTIHGQAEDRCYTLLQSFCLTVNPHWMTGSTSERVHVNAMLEADAWFTDIDDLAFDRVCVGLRHLTAWVGHTGLSRDYPELETPDDKRFAVATALALPNLDIPHSDGRALLCQTLEPFGDDLHEVGVRQSWLLRLHYDSLRPVQTLIDTVSDIQDLLSLAVGTTADIDALHFEHPDLLQLSMAGTPIGNLRSKVTYHAQWSNTSTRTEPVKRHEMYFTFDDFGGIEGVGRWLTVAARYRTEVGRAMATRYSRNMYLEDRIMNVAAALDSLDKTHRSSGKWVKYADRLQHCIDLAGQPFLNLIRTDPSEWVAATVEVRDDLAHHRNRFRVEGQVGEHLLAEQLFWLFTLCMLRLAEAPSEVFDRIGGHRQVKWLRDRALSTSK